MKAPGDYRPTWRNGIIQIHITRACDLSCTSCTQGSNLAGKPTIITLENFKLACESLKDYFGVIGIFGGNPCLHPRFEEICHIISEIIPYEQRGLWSNNLNGYGELCRKTFNPAVSNLNVHTSKDAYDEMKRDWPECGPIGLSHDSRHSPPYVAMQDLGLTNAEMELLISKCDINQLWSSMLCQVRGELRAFFCELAGAQSMLHENEYDYPDTGLKVFPGWWRLPIENFENQIYKHCFECGVPLKGLGDLAVNGENEFVSKTHEKIYQLKRPKGKFLHVVENRKDLGGEVNRATDYIKNGIESMNTSEVRVLIGVPTPGYSKNDTFYHYHNCIQKPAGTLVTFATGQSPARNRNMIIQQALDNNCTHVLFLDDDTAPPPDLLTRLLAHDKDIVTGLYFMRAFPHQPIIFDYADENGKCAWHLLNPGETGLIEIVASGLGACLIKIDVFRKMVELGLAPETAHGRAWVQLGELEKDHWCDDIGFFRRVREAGYKMYCDLDIKVGHFTQVTVLPNYIDGKWYTSYDSRGTSQVTFPQSEPVKEITKEEAVA